MNLLKALNHRQRHDAAVADHRARPGNVAGGAVRRGNADGRVPGGVPPAQHPAADVRGGRLLAGVRADPGRIPASARRRCHARSRRSRGRAAGTGAAGRDGAGRTGGPGAGLPPRERLCRDAREGRTDRGPHPHRLSLHPVRVAGVARRRRPATSTGASPCPRSRRSCSIFPSSAPRSSWRNTSIRRSRRWPGACSSAASRNSRSRSLRSRASACLRVRAWTGATTACGASCATWDPRCSAFPRRRSPR